MSHHGFDKAGPSFSNEYVGAVSGAAKGVSETAAHEKHIDDRKAEDPVQKVT